MADVNPQTVPSDQGNAVIAITYVFVIVTLLFTGLRITVAWLRARKFGVDDIFLAWAMFVGLLSAICNGTAAVNGLGRSVTLVHSNQLYNYFKLSYSSQLFMILAMAASKHSIIALVQRLTPLTSPIYRYIRWFHVVIAAWATFTIFGVGFQCGFPAPWIYSPSRCSGSGAIWYPVTTTSIVIDAILAFTFIPITRDTQMESRKRMEVMVLFLSRLIVPVFSIAYIATLAPALTSVDQTQAMTVPSIIAQIAMDLSIVTAAAPALSRIVMSLEPASPATVVSEITAVDLNPTHSRATSDENNKLRDWAFAQLRNTPTPSSMTKEMSVDLSSSPKKPDELHLRLERVQTAPPIPPRSDRRSASPHVTLNFTHQSAHLDVKEAWFVDSKRTSANTENTLDDIKTESAQL